MEVNNLISSTIVSSVLNRDVKQFGKKFLFDNNDDTCWNSDQVSNVAIIFWTSVMSHQQHVNISNKFLRYFKHTFMYVRQ